MALRKREKPGKRLAGAELDAKAEELAARMADKRYGDESVQVQKSVEKTDSRRRITLSLSNSMVQQCEEIAFKNKSEGLAGPKNTSALVEIALAAYLNNVS